MHTATSSQTITVSDSTSPLSATASGNPTSGQIPLTTNFTGSAAGGTPPYTYSWNFGDSGSSSNTSTAQNPSHTYNNVGSFTATLTVTDSASPTHTATSTVAVTADPIASAPPAAPTGLTATAGTNQVSLSWTAPSNTGGQTLTAYTVYRGTASGSETKLISGGCSGLSGTTVSCTDSGLTAGTTYFYKVTASNPTGEGAQSNEASATPTGASSCAAAQLIGNPGFETGTASPWTASSGVVSNNTSEPPHSGTWDAWMDGYSAAHTDTLSQAFTIPAGCNTSTLSFWLHIDTAHTGTSVIDTLKVQLLNSAGTILTTLATYSNLDKDTGYVQKSFSVGGYAGQGAITLKLTGVQANSVQTSFVTDDWALSASGSGGTANTVTVTNPGNQTSTAATAISPLQIHATDSASGQTLTYSANGLPDGLSISSSGQITGTPTTAGTNSVTVTAKDTTNASGSATFTWTVNAASGGCTAAQLLGDPGFESGGSGSAWTTTSTVGTATSVFNNSSSEPPHSGTWDLWLDGYGKTDTDTAAQTVAIPSTCKNATLTFWLHIDTAEPTTTTKYDTLKLDILNSSGTVLSTPGTWSNLDHNTGYKQWSVNLASYVGQTIKIRFTGSEDSIDQTSFVLDDAAANVS